MTDKLIHKFWKEGKYLDFWSIPHIIVGFLLGFIFFDLLNFSMIISLAVVAILKIGWEIWEEKFLIKEVFSNKVFDVLCGIVGFLILYYLEVQNEVNTKIFVGVILLWIILSIWGLKSMQKLSSNKKRLVK